MTKNDIWQWMGENGYLDMWWLPINGCNTGTVYAKNPVGDSLEVIPLDCSLNEDLHWGVHQHITLTTLLETNDPQ